jgi:thiamine transport system permease protein
MLLSRLEAIPHETWRLADQLALPPSTQWRVIEWPALRASLPGVSAVILLICVTSFAIILTLGGGPSATTLEVAIYQALRFDFDPPRAVMLSLLQMVLCAGLIAVLRGAGAEFVTDAALNRSLGRAPPSGSVSAAADAISIAGIVLFTGLPVLAVCVAGLRSGLAPLAEPIVWRAIATSLVIGTAAAAIAVAGAWCLVAAARDAGPTNGQVKLARRTGRLLEGHGAIILVVPPFVIGAGWFLMLNAYGLAFTLAPAAIIAVNALMVLPYAVRVLAAADGALGRDHQRLCQGLALGGWRRFRLIDWPLLSGAFAFAWALSAALSLGDLGIAALFGSERLTTVPLLLQQRLGTYHAADANSLALLLGLMCLGLFVTAAMLDQRRKGASR